MEPIVTERLVLEAGDVPAFAAYRRDPAVARHQGWDAGCEGRLVEADWFKGELTTLRTYAVLRREWQAQKPSASNAASRRGSSS